MTFEEWFGIQTPCDLEAEQAVLGSILLEPEVLNVVLERIQESAFYSKAHGKIFRQMLNVVESGKALDLITLTAALKDSGELEDVGGASYLVKLTGAVPTAANAAHYADRVRDMFIRRQSIETAAEMLKKAAREQDINSFMSAADEAMLKLSEQASPAQDFKPLRDVLVKVWEQNEIKYNSRDTNRGVTGIPSGFPDLDRMTSGFQRSDFIVMAARPSMGKTALALNIAQNVAKITGETVGFFSLEMSSEQLGQRMLAAESNVDGSRMRTGFFEIDDWEKMSAATGALSEAPIFIDDTPGIMVSEIRAKCRRLKKQHGLGLVIIDYLQLVNVPQVRGQNREQQVAQISRMLKALAKELDVPVIALSQLSRGVEQRQDKRPMLSDLRESGAIEQDADVVMFLYRDDYYDKETEKQNIVEVIIAKQRNGPVGTVELVFLKNYNKFVSLERGHDQPAPRREPDPRRRWA